MAKAKKPKKCITLLGVPFEVIFQDKIDDDGDTVSGLCYGSGHRIYISTEENKTPEEINSTLLHECIHAILYVSGQSQLLKEDHEEGIVIALESALAPLISLELEET